jgi:uncharacterized protein (TIGR00297 family)
MLAVALAVNAALAAAAYIAGAVTLSGVVGGFVVGFAILYFGGWGAFAVLVLFFVGGSAATKLGYSRKAALGVAQEAKGRRGAKHAFANCGAAAMAAVLYGWLARDGGAAWVLAAFTGAFATALFDTVSSEVGQLYGKHPFLITTFKPVPVGTDGAVSIEGTAAGLAAAAAMGAFGAALGLYPWAAVVYVAAGAFVGTTFESIIGTLGSARKRINNELLNFLNTVVGGAAAGLLCFLFAK